MAKKLTTILLIIFIIIATVLVTFLVLCLNGTIAFHNFKLSLEPQKSEKISYNETYDTEKLNYIDVNNNIDIENMSKKEPNNSSKINSIEELNIKDEDGLGRNYTFEYNNNIFKAQYTKDNWKIIDSYKIKNEKDIKIICNGLINIHPILGKDGKSYRTAEDMVNEWKIHNIAYELLPEKNEWKASAKDVDFDSKDQGKNLEDFIKERVKK